MHLVKGAVKQPPAAAAPAPATAPRAAAAASPASPFGGMFGAGAGRLGAGLPGAMLSDPAAMRAMMESPMMASVMSNPALMESIMMSNPATRAVLESNPELRCVFVTHAPCVRACVTCRRCGAGGAAAGMRAGG